MRVYDKDLVQLDMYFHDIDGCLQNSAASKSLRRPDYATGFVQMFGIVKPEDINMPSVGGPAYAFVLGME